MRTLGRLLIGYLLAGLLIAVLENWIAHTRSGGSILEVVVSSEPTGDKIAAFYDLVLFPVVAWPVRVMAYVRGG